MPDNRSAGPLAGVKVVELAGLGPAPYCGTLLADLGAEVIRIDRASRHRPIPPTMDVLSRGRQSIALDLKRREAVEIARRLIADADVLIEGFRPGVMERIGLGPDLCLEINPRLIYGRMTGWGQNGPLAKSAGHDINYIAFAGVLGMIGYEGERPIAPLNLVGDMGGGGLLLAFGIACSLFEAQRSGKGQVIDAAMIEGAASQLSAICSMRAAGHISRPRGANVIDGGSHFYQVYETADGKFIAVGASEPQFYQEFCDVIGADPDTFAAQLDADRWPMMTAQLEQIFRTKTRDEWSAIFLDKDACVSPVLSIEEAAAHPHGRARDLFITRDGILQPGAVPKFSRTPGEIAAPPPPIGRDADLILERIGYDRAKISRLRQIGAVQSE